MVTALLRSGCAAFGRTLGTVAPNVVSYLKERDNCAPDPPKVASFSVQERKSKIIAR